MKIIILRALLLKSAVLRSKSLWQKPMRSDVLTNGEADHLTGRYTSRDKTRSTRTVILNGLYGWTRKIAAHILNTSRLRQPIGVKRTLAAQSGWEIAYDGTEIMP